MALSKLAKYIRDENEHSGRRKNDLKFITPHCTAGNKNSTAKSIIDFMCRPGGSSVQYAIGGDGSIGASIDEDNRSWCTSSGWNDNRAITIEVASNIKGTEVTEEAIQSLISLMVDICKRHKKTKLISLTKDKTISMIDMGLEDDDTLYITQHNWFAAKSCPGPYIISRLNEIVTEVNKRLTQEIEGDTNNNSNYKIIQDRYKFSDETMEYLANYKYSDSLLNKLANGIGSENSLYRIQCGAFSKKDNALNLYNKLKADGYDTNIVKY